MHEKIAVIGVGFLGKKLLNFMSNQFDVVGADISYNEDELIKRVDASNENEIKDFLITEKPDIVINTVALSSYVMCENNYELCKKLNYNTAVNILNVCNDISAKMVFMSSSYVFSGDKGNYLETDLPNASNHYAISKIAAENEILKSKASIVIRSEPMYGFDEIRKELVIGTNSFEGYFEVGYSDLIRNPILIDDIPNVIYHLIKKNVSGIFNVAGTDNLKWLEFVSKLSKLINQEDKIRIVDPSDWMLKPPHDTSLDVTKINKIGITTTSFSKALEKLAKIL